MPKYQEVKLISSLNKKKITKYIEYKYTVSSKSIWTLKRYLKISECYCFKKNISNEVASSDARAFLRTLRHVFPVTFNNLHVGVTTGVV